MRGNAFRLGLLFAVLGWGSFVPAPPVHAQNAFPEVVKRWSGLTLGGPGRPVKDLRLSAGHLTLVLGSGSASPVLAGNETVGIYFRGQGQLEYVSADPVEFPIVSFNVRKNTGLAAASEGATLAIRDKFEEVLWLAGGIATPAVAADPAGTSLDAAFGRHAKRFSQAYLTPIAHQFAAWRLNGPDKPQVRAEIAGGDAELVYALDGLDGKSETLMALRESQFIDDRLDLVVLSDQPIGRDRRDPLIPRFLLTDVDLSVTATDEKNVSLSVTETVLAAKEPTSALVLSLYDTRYVESNLGNPQPRKLRVKGVFDENGAALPFDHAKDEIVIGLAKPAMPGAPIKMRFELEGDILYNPGGDSYWELGTEPWFPQPDLAGQYYTVHSTVKVKKPFVPLVPGKTVRRVEEGEWNVLETRIEKPVQFMVVLAGKYAFEEETKNNVTVRIASYAGKNKIAAAKLMNLTHKIIDYYEGFLGPFPFDEFNVVEINDWGWGQAPPGFMFITSEAFNPIGGEINQLFSKGINERFSHEIAHQYWGHVVKMPSHEEQWITESFAEICAGLFIRQLRGKSDFQGLVATWRSRAKEAAATAPIPLANRIRAKSDRITAFTHRTYLLYFKGPCILNTVREEIGEQPFLVFLRSCQATLVWKFGNTKTVEAVLEAITKKDWKPFFEENYWGTAMPAK